MDKRKILFIIPARKESKGIKNKNKLKIGKLTLIEYSIIEALKTNLRKKIVLTTDDTDIINIGKNYDVEIPFIRPSKLSNDKSRIEEVILHCLRWYQKNDNFYPDYFILLQPTTPLRQAKDIKKAFYQLIKNKKKSLISVSKVKHHPSEYIIKKNNSFKYVLDPKNN